MVVRVDASQSMTVTNVESAKCEVKRHGLIEEITERRGEHADAVERNDAARWSFVLLQLCGADEIVLDHLGDFGVAREAKHDLVDDVFEHKVLVVVGGRELDVFEDQLVGYQVGAQNVSLKICPDFVVLKKVQ